MRTVGRTWGFGGGPFHLKLNVSFGYWWIVVFWHGMFCAGMDGLDRVTVHCAKGMRRQRYIYSYSAPSLINYGRAFAMFIIYNGLGNSLRYMNVTLNGSVNIRCILHYHCLSVGVFGFIGIDVYLKVKPSIHTSLGWILWHYTRSIGLHREWNWRDRLHLLYATIWWLVFLMGRPWMGMEDVVSYFISVKSTFIVDGRALKLVQIIWLKSLLYGHYFTGHRYCTLRNWEYLVTHY